MVTDYAKPLALQAVLYFLMARLDGKTRPEAIADFIGSKLCQEFGENLTVANVYGLAAAAGYGCAFSHTRGGEIRP